ncbi:MAG: hypothetical protein Q8R60_16765 [Mycobacteriales bacterium]|nr:hypothetical protein [Mycobacteriales bacterium]
MTNSVLAVVTAAEEGGGAALGEVAVASALGGGLTAALLAVAWAHRTRRTTLLTRAGTALGRSTGVPGWVALPTLFCTTSLLTALFGMYWDISLHIGQGRDEGPLANPAHYFILFGLFGVFAAGVLAIVMPLDEKPGSASVRITRDWHAPVGGLLLAGAGLYALMGFPLDDVWHRIFGQDVTLWGPTHLMLIGGAGLSLIGLLVLEQEARHRGGSPAGRQLLIAKLRRASAAGGMLIGLSVFQGEFDFGVPQFRLVEQPALIAGAAAITLVATRMWSGRGAALGAVGFFLAIRGVVGLIVGVGLDEPMPSLPLYLGSALVVEVVAVLLARRPLLLGAVAGVLVGTVGTATEYAWSQVAMTLPWGSDMLVEGVLGSAVVGLAGGVIGALLALGLRGELPSPRTARPLFAASLVAIAVVVGNGLIATVPSGMTADLALGPVTDGRAVVTARFSEAVDDPSWLQVTAWQGAVPDGLKVVPLVEQADGSWASEEPVPVAGQWKTLLRLHDGRTLAALPVYMAADPGISAEEVPAVDATRTFIAENVLLQRERKLDVPGWVWAASSSIVLVCTLVLVLALAWGVSRVSRARAAVASDRVADSELVAR